MNAAIKEKDHREAQLDEANQNLEAALDVGAGRVGRYSGSIAGQFRLGDLLAQGAMGEVYVASHLQSSQPAAVKLLRERPGDRGDRHRRFLREAEIAWRVKAINVVHVYEIGQMADGALFIAMEQLKGHDLAWHLRKHTSLPLGEVSCLLEQVGAGLSAAHAAGVVHRDIKPQNLFLDERSPESPTWKVVDFGISKLRDWAGTLTEGTVLGTPGYMSPEQARGVEADVRSDVFSLGAVVYRALCGRPPFSGPDMPSVLFDVVFRNPQPPSATVAELPPDVEPVLAIALAKKPDDRFAAISEFVDAFRRAAAGQLDAAIRDRGRAILATHPWGKRLTSNSTGPAAAISDDAPTANRARVAP
jgi:serine/threonine-protein kinase